MAIAVIGPPAPLRAIIPHLQGFHTHWHSHRAGPMRAAAAPRGLTVLFLVDGSGYFPPPRLLSIPRCILFIHILSVYICFYPVQNAAHLTQNGHQPSEIHSTMSLMCLVFFSVNGTNFIISIMLII